MVRGVASVSDDHQLSDKAVAPVLPYAVEMRVEVNAELCQGHNRCYALAPELFDVDDYGTAVVIGDGTVAGDLVDKANLAVANCPEYAITIVEG
jgi:ferredoxin